MLQIVILFGFILI